MLSGGRKVNRRDWLKAASWETVSLVLTFLIGSFWLGGVKLTLFAVCVTVVKVPFFALHNSLWRTKKV